MSEAAELFAALPLTAALSELRPQAPVPSRSFVEALAPALAGRPAELAALFLYVDDLDAAHQLVQPLETPLGAWLHAIVHRREGDFSNSLYWYHRAASREELRTLGLTPRQFVAAVQGGEEPEAMVALQREEWKLAYEAACKETA
jgi:hypothetical protein